MVRGTLLPSIFEVERVCLRPRLGLIEVELRTSRPFSCCPVCGTASQRVHSRYLRRLGDLPWQGIPVSILLQTRKSSVSSRLAADVSLPNRFPAPCFAIAGGRCVLVKLWTGLRS